MNPLEYPPPVKEIRDQVKNKITGRLSEGLPHIDIGEPETKTNKYGDPESLAKSLKCPGNSGGFLNLERPHIQIAQGKLR